MSPLPETVQRFIADGTQAWVNEIGGITYLLGEEFCKIGPLHPEFSPRVEADRMAWVRAWLPVPLVLDADDDGHTGWLRTRRIAGECASTVEPSVAVPALGRALRRFHDVLPVVECPWQWAVADRLAHAKEKPPTPVPDIDQFVVCHGDACNPNFLLDEGACVGYVDLQTLGVADRWADLAPAVMSLTWNYGPGWADTFLDAYGVVCDERLAWYQWLWNAT